MRGKSPIKVAVAATAIALFAAGCQSSTEPEAPAESGGTLRIGASEPSSLLPGWSDDSPSIIMIRQLYRGLVYYHPETGEPVMDHAESIESDDNLTWTVKLKKGWKFTDGEEVTADSYINAWNATSYGPNAFNNSYFMSHIDGWKDLQSEDPDGDGPQKAPEPKAKELSGLKKVDDHTFTVKLDKPFVGFPAVVGYSGFFPNAKACIADLEKCRETPIGNGPYKLDGEWKHNVEVTLVRNANFAGEKGKADTLAFTIYDKIETGYAAFEAGELDIWEGVPAPKFTDAKAKYADTMFQKPSNSFTYVGFPLYDAKFQDKKLRQALSMAIDRQAIIDAVFNGRFSVAQGVVSPNFDGYREGACKYCKVDVAAAKKLLEEYGGAAKVGKITLWANAGAGHDQWLKAVGDQWKANLGIDYELKIDLQFPEYLATGDDAKFTGPFRLGWGPDYAVVETYLGPLYSTNGSSNNSRYSNPAFDALIDQGNGAATLDEGIKFYNQAEDLVLEDMPVLPMWFGMVTNVYGPNVAKYEYNTISGTDYHRVAVKQ